MASWSLSTADLFGFDFSEAVGRKGVCSPHHHPGLESGWPCELPRKELPWGTEGGCSCLWLQPRIATGQLVPGHQEATSTVGGSDILEPKNSNKQTWRGDKGGRCPGGGEHIFKKATTETQRALVPSCWQNVRAKASASLAWEQFIRAADTL